MQGGHWLRLASFPPSFLSLAVQGLYRLKLDNVCSKASQRNIIQDLTIVNSSHCLLKCKADTGCIAFQNNEVPCIHIPSGNYKISGCLIIGVSISYSQLQASPQITAVATF